MLSLGPIGFTSPWLLAALALLPAIWWLLRITPPAPRRMGFPPIRFLLRLVSREETPAQTPLWLLILRMVLATLLIIALAGPVLNPEPELEGDGPLVLVVDDGWAAAPGWPQRIEALRRLAESAVRDGREVVLVRTAPEAGGVALRRLPATDALEQVPSLLPRPWPVDRAAALAAIEEQALDGADIVWLSDGIAGDPEDRRIAADLALTLRRIGPLQILADDRIDLAHLLVPPTLEGDQLRVEVRRADAGPPRHTEVRALGPGGEPLATRGIAFAEGQRSAGALLDVPLELRNRIARIELVPMAGVGDVVLLDERWRRRTVGLIGVSETGEAQPLLSELYYVERALRPFAEIRRGGIQELLDAGPSMIVLPDIARLDGAGREGLDAWIESGGVVVRFAGPRLAAGGDDLVPVQLRLGDRSLGGALSWDQPLPLAAFDDDGPLAGLAVPDDVFVRRQVLAQPGPDLVRRTLARLVDGTPLITGEQRGKGWLVLVHTTASTAWSNLPISGLFVAILRRMLALAPGVGGEVEGTLAPIATLDARGHLGEPPPTALPIASDALSTTLVSPLHPPGLYGPVIAEGEAAETIPRQALNLAGTVTDPVALTATNYGVAPQRFGRSTETPLAPWLLVAALAIAIADTFIGLAMRGLLPRLSGAATTGAILLLAGGAQAADEDRILEVTGETRLAYVLTGVDEVDAISGAGLYGLTRTLNQRTAVDAAEPIAVDVATDDLALYPLLYWPIPPEHPDLADGVIERLDNYLRQGGMIIFDTLDAGTMIPGQPAQGSGARRLTEMLGDLDVAPLMPVPEDHALTRAFYLLQEFPGRWMGQPVWVDRPRPGVNDDVSAVIIGAHDWAGAWALNDTGQAILPVLPGGERQREMARRFGVNLVMYALTGNYKTDQVHVPALLERLGQ